jgi:hypothetical protein
MIVFYFYIMLIDIAILLDLLLIFYFYIAVIIILYVINLMLIMNILNNIQ